MGLENCTFVVDFGHQIPPDANVDLVLTFDCLHDMPRPDLTANAVRQAIAENGTWLIKDIRSTGDFVKDQRNPLLALFYGFSIALMLAISDFGARRSWSWHPRVASRAGRENSSTTPGFAGFATLDLEDAGNLYYEVTVNQ